MSKVAGAKQAVLYLRVSSRGQVETDYDPEGNSIPAQRKACLRKAEKLGMEVADEYVEPGRSALSVDGRPKFQEMMAQVRNKHDVDAIIVYARSRMHRDTADAAITRRELKKHGVQLISIMDYTEDSYRGDLVASILDGVNEYQSRASGADVSYKMAAKAANGGTPGKASLGYRNVGEKVDGREVRTVAVDEERAPFVTMMFELYATGRYSFRELQWAVTEAGLRTRPTENCPAGRELPMYTLGNILRNRYYLGRLTYKGVEHQGRHTPLVSQELFDRVQDVLRQNNAGTRKRVHDHPLKGILWCRHCDTRFHLDTVKNRRGIAYSYFLCSGRAGKRCPTPRVPVAKMEAEVAAHYATLRVPPTLATTLRESLDQMLGTKQQFSDDIRARLTAERKRLEAKQDHLLELVGDPDWPQERLNEKMCDLRDRLAGIAERLEQVGVRDFEKARQAVELVLELLDDPRRFLRTIPERHHKAVHTAFFGRLYVVADEGSREPRVVGDQVTAPLAPLVEMTRGSAESGETTPENTKRPGFRAACSDKTSLAGVPGLEPRTTEPESAVLPITPYPNGVWTL